MPPSQTKGKTHVQRAAFRELLKVRGGVEFLVYRPAQELEELGLREVCSAELMTILRNLVGLEVERRRLLLQALGQAGE